MHGHHASPFYTVLVYAEPHGYDSRSEVTSTEYMKMFVGLRHLKNTNYYYLGSYWIVVKGGEPASDLDS